MKNKKYQAQRKLLSNKHLKEWNDNIKLEVKELYTLRNRHEFERNRLVGERIVKNNEHSVLAALHFKEIEELQKSNAERRLTIQARHHQEKNQF